MTRYRKEIYENYGRVQAFREQSFSLENLLGQSKYYARLLKGHLPSDKTCRCLDCGCGAGNFLYFLKSQGYVNISGVDLSPEQIALAQKLSLNVVQGDIFDYLKSADPEFGLISALDLLEHLTKNEIYEILSMIRNALIPGGIFLGRTPNGASPLVGGVYFGDFTHETCLTPHSLTQLLLTAGFQEIHCFEQKPLPIGLISGIRAALWRPIRLFYKFLDAVETGGLGRSVLTQAFWFRAVK